MSEIRQITNAEYATIVATISRIAVHANESLVRGMWNPLFCADGAEVDALEEIERVIAHYRNGGYRAMRYEHGLGYVDTSKESGDGS